MKKMMKDISKSVYIKIGEVQYKLFLSMNEIDIPTGIKLMNIIESDMNELSKKRRVIAIMCNCGINELNEVLDSEIKTLYPTIESIINNCENAIYKTIKCDGQLFGLIDLDKMTVEEYMDIDYSFRNGENPIDTSIMLMDAVYKPIHTSAFNKMKAKIGQISMNKSKLIRTNINGKRVDTDISYADSFRDNISTGYALSVCSAIDGLRTALHGDYEDVFSKDTDNRDNGLAEEIKTNVNKKPQIVSINDSWGLYDSLNVVCNNNKSEFDNWLKKPVREFLTYLCYMVQKNKEITNKNK